MYVLYYFSVSFDTVLVIIGPFYVIFVTFCVIFVIFMSLLSLFVLLLILLCHYWHYLYNYGHFTSVPLTVWAKSPHLSIAWSPCECMCVSNRRRSSPRPSPIRATRTYMRPRSPFLSPSRSFCGIKKKGCLINRETRSLKAK